MLVEISSRKCENTLWEVEEVGERAEGGGEIEGSGMGREMGEEMGEEAEGGTGDESGGESVYLMLNLDGSLPFPGFLCICFFLFNCQFGKRCTSRLGRRRYQTPIFSQELLTSTRSGALPLKSAQQ